MDKAILLEKSQKYLKMSVDDIASEDDARVFVDELAEVTKAHNELYYIYASPLIADGQYDQLFDLLLALEKKFPDLITPESPTQTLSVQIADGFTKKEHGYKILSLKNSYNAGDLRDWVSLMERKISSPPNPLSSREGEFLAFSFVVEPKFDGSSVHLIYKYGKFVAGITRGDGVVGEDITHNIKMVHNLPLFLSGAEDIEELHLRAEVMMPKNAFEALNAYQKEEGLPIFANPRNATAGTLRQLDPAVVRERGLVLFIHELIKLQASSSKLQASSYSQQQKFLKSLGLPIFDRVKQFDDIDEVIALCEDEKTKQELDAMNLEFDGLVIKIDSLSIREQLGATEHHPRRAMAYKFPAKQVATKLLDISYQIGRTGAITPVAELEPVTLSGAVISRATLHNFDYIANLDIRRGDRVRVQRSGEVIPYILGPLVESRTGKEEILQEPTHCPVCHTPLIRKAGEVALLCPNDACPARVKEQLKHFVSKSCMNIDGLGEQVIELLLETGLVKNIVDIYRLHETQKRMQLRALPGLGSKKITQILQEIEKSKGNPLRRLLHGLGIPYVGKKVAKTLEKERRTKNEELRARSNIKFTMQNIKYKSATLGGLDELITFMTDRDRLLEIFGIGEQGVDALVEWFHDAQHLALLQSLDALGIQPWKQQNEEKKVESGEGVLEPGNKKERVGGLFDGKTYVLTGIFPITREALTQWIEQQGGNVSSSVTSKTDYVLYGEKAGSKKQKAESLGITCLDWNTFSSQHPELTSLISLKTKKDDFVQGGLFG